MSTLAGFVAGYLLGAKHGPDGLAKLRTAFESVLASPEVQGILSKVPDLGDVAAGISGGFASASDGDGRAGEGRSERADTLRALMESEAVQNLVAGGLDLARSVLERGLGLMKRPPAG